MALKVELKPNERIIVGTAIIRNGGERARLFIEGQAPILREKDILTPTTATTPARRVYLAVQLIYLSNSNTTDHELYFQLVTEFLSAAPSSLPIVAEINNRILNGELYKAMKAARELVAYEEKLIANVSRSEELREGSPTDTDGTGS
jgi:flagellar biosynthesis repressor protein FlbT